MTAREKFNERKGMMVVAFGYVCWGVFIGITIGQGLDIYWRIGLSAVLVGFNFYATGSPLEKIKAKLFPSHPDYKPPHTNG